MYVRVAVRGFTIVELLIVVVVIAILAAITIVAYNGVTERAQRSSLQSRAGQLQRSIELYKADNGVYPTDATALGVDADVYLVNSDTDPTQYCVTANEETISYSVSSAGGEVVEGHCVQNLIPNPSAEINADNWGENSGRYGQRSTDWALEGAGSFLTYNNSASSASLNYRISTGGSVPVEAGETYTLSAHVRDYNGNTQPVSIRLDWRDDATTNLQPNANSDSAAVDATGSLFRVTGEAHASATVVRVWLTSSSAPVNTGFYADAVMLTQGDLLYSYGDGDSPGWFWTGTPHNSSSIGPALLAE